MQKRSVVVSRELGGGWVGWVGGFNSYGLKGH